MTIRELFPEDKTYTPLEFAQKFCANEKDAALPIYDHDSLRDWLDANGFEALWDLPISEVDEVIEHKIPVVLVAVTVDGYIQSRWYETTTKELE